MTTTRLLPHEVNDFDFIIVGGGTAGCVVARRLADYLPRKKILLIEAGPSDFGDDRIQLLKEWEALIGGAFDYDYETTEQPEGNSFIRHCRAKVLGGCSSHNTLITFRPFAADCARWVEKGCEGWDFDTFTRLVDKLRTTFQPVAYKHRAKIVEDFVTASAAALQLPVVHDFNHEIRETGGTNGVGFLSVAYNPDDGRRNSASSAYIHPLLAQKERCPNLTILTDAWVNRIIVKHEKAMGVDITLQHGENLVLRQKLEIVVCAGAIDSPRLLLLSGIGPRDDLSKLNIPVTAEVPGVGHNLIDHPETVLVWELEQRVPPGQTTMYSDAAVLFRRDQVSTHASDPYLTSDDDVTIPNAMLHMYTIPLCLNTERLGYETPQYGFSITPNIPRPLSRGQLYLTSNDPKVKPALDFKYFTDPEGHDKATLLAGVKAARLVAQQSPLKEWLKREIAPGPSIQTDHDLSTYARKVAHSVYHPAGTCKMGNIHRDRMAVVDPALKVRAVQNLRVADASVFPDMPTINPMITVLAIGERMAEVLAAAYAGPAHASSDYQTTDPGRGAKL
ncbi:hypothetical protein B0A52_03792 [Exophiala mesophila]|uniref:Glucose-methanol-choline oxidoreductase N-terminal domain-containing protein n=1 Tax=Exophiala mesophila TaxID=212818 RepID=A0A438N7H7_EXOME|nr:hypothetical protein B0A52_03792 [Exophiala mesophila]